MNNPDQRSWVNIDLSAFEYNYIQLNSRIKSVKTYMQIVKADAYGHGAYEIARKALKLGASLLGVANVEEALLLRYQDIKAPIVVLSPCLKSEIYDILEHDLTPVIPDPDFAKALNNNALKLEKKVNVHLEVDSGMGRSGLSLKEARKTVDIIKNLSCLNLESVFSHFASSESDPAFTEDQFKIYKNFIQDNDLQYIRYLHISNSSGLITFPEDFTNLVRVGLLSYGIYPTPFMKEIIDLKPVMTFKSKILQIKEALKGESIGYNRTFTADKIMHYAIIPVGYADGYDYLLSGKGVVFCKGNLCRILGKVSMDMIAIDITNLNDLETGNEVTLLGAESEEIRAENLVKKYSGLSYELVSQIGRRAKRFYQENKRTISSSPLSRRHFISRDFDDKKLNRIIESSINQRLQSREISNVVYSEILKKLFFDKDNDIHYRKNFKHSVKFELPKDARYKDFFLTTTTLSFTKKLQNDYFYITCARSNSELSRYFTRRDVEYRWLLDRKFRLTKDFFAVTSVTLDGIELSQEIKLVDDCLEIRCSHPALKRYIDKESEFSISTKTFYPKNSHQFGIYIVEMTKGIELSFSYPEIISNVEIIPIFSGNLKYPDITDKDNKITITNQKHSWIFPNSAVIFVY